MLRLDGARWRELVQLQWPGSLVDANVDAQTAFINGLSLSPDAKEIAATSSVGTAFFDLSSFTLGESLEGADYRRWQPQQECLGSSGEAIAFDGNKAFLVNKNRLLRLAKTCRNTPVAAADKTVTLVDIHLTDNAQPLAVGTQGGKLVSLDDTGDQNTVAESGPYAAVEISYQSNGTAYVAAVNQAGGFAYNLETGQQEAGVAAHDHLSLGTDNLVAVSYGYAALLSPKDSVDATGVNFPQADPRAVKWLGDKIVVLDQSGPIASTPTGDLDGSTQRPLQLPEPGCQGWASLAVSPDGKRAAATALCPSRTRRGAYVWDFGTSDDPKPVAVPGRTLYLAFTADNELVGGMDRTLTKSREKDGTWEHVATRDVEQNIGAIAADVANHRIGLVIAASSTTAPTLLTIDSSSLSDRHRLPLKDATGLAQLATLSDGRIAMAYGSGRLLVASADLTTTTTLELKDSYFFSSMVELPSDNELLIAARNKVFTIDLARLVEKEGNTSHWFGTSSLDISPNGKYLAQGSIGYSRVRVSTVDSGTLRARACLAIGRDLTPGEWDQYVGSAHVKQFTLCERTTTPTPTPRRSPHNGFDNQMGWQVTTSAVGDLTLGLAQATAIDTGLMVPSNGCDIYHLDGNWLDPATGGPALFPTFSNETLEAVLVEGRAFRTSNGSGVGDTLSVLQSRYESDLHTENISSNAGNYAAPVIEDDNGLIIFNLDDQDLVTGMTVTRRTSGKIELELGC